MALIIFVGVLVVVFAVILFKTKGNGRVWTPDPDYDGQKPIRYDEGTGTSESQEGD